MYGDGGFTAGVEVDVELVLDAGAELLLLDVVPYLYGDGGFTAGVEADVGVDVDVDVELELELELELVLELDTGAELLLLDVVP